jgi:hypothetical protein
MEVGFASLSPHPGPSPTLSFQVDSIGIATAIAISGGSSLVQNQGGM